MGARDKTEEFFESLSGAYFGSEADVTKEFLQGECKLLSYLNKDRSASYQPGELSRELGVSTARVAATLNSLERKGYICRCVSTEDKRKVFVKITDNGAEYILKKREGVCSFFDKIFDGFSEKEADEFIRLIRKAAEISHKE